MQPAADPSANLVSGVSPTVTTVPIEPVVAAPTHRQDFLQNLRASLQQQSLAQSQASTNPPAAQVTIEAPSEPTVPVQTTAAPAAITEVVMPTAQSITPNVASVLTGGPATATIGSVVSPAPQSMASAPEANLPEVTTPGVTALAEPAPEIAAPEDELASLEAAIAAAERAQPALQVQPAPPTQSAEQLLAQAPAQPSSQISPQAPAETPVQALAETPVQVPEVVMQQLTEPATDPSAFLSASALPQVVPTTVLQATDTLNPAFGGVAQTKEAVSAQTVTPAETATGIQQVEVEPQVEIPPEVEGYLQKIEDDTQQAPKEIVIADGKYEPPVEHPYPSQPVVVLPITPQIEEKAKFKSPKFSVKWLVEWSHKIIKIFMGKVIYRQA